MNHFIIKANRVFFVFVPVLLILGCSKKPLGNPALVEVEPLIRFNYTASEINDLCQDIEDYVLVGVDKVVGIGTEKANFENTVHAIDLLMVNSMNQIQPAQFLKYVSQDEKLRNVAGECELKIEKLMVDIYTREDLYQMFKAVASKETAVLDSVQKELLDDFNRSFRRYGLDLTPEKRKEYKEKKKRLAELENAFSKNNIEYTDYLEVTRDELDGMTDSYISSLKTTSDGKFKISMSYPHFYPFMENGKNAEVRRRLEEKFYHRGGQENVGLLEEAIKLRHELAQLLGYPTHAAYVLEERMAKKVETVNGFLLKLKEKLHPRGKKDLEALLALKKKELGDQESKINSWDWRYYENQMKKTQFQVDQEKIKEYFPLDIVLKGMFEVYQTLLSVQFEKTNDIPTWNSDVLAYAVKKNGKVVSYFYMDLFPREGKYEHAAAFTLRSGFLQQGGGYTKPVSSIVANFNPPTDGQPSLLLHSEVETLFHEFGHIMHQVLTKASYGTFSGTRVKRDFVEAPSQMLENWVWDKKSLKKLSGHYKNPSEPLPDALLDSLIKAKLANVGIRYLRQLFFATLDMTYHVSPSVDSTQLYQDLSTEIMLIPIPDGTIPQASFGHLMGGYDAGYYGYLWSEVYAQDMFTRFQKEGLLNPKPGADYVKWILEPGGSVDPFKLITSFLGREPNEKAFFKSLGL